MNRLFLDPEKPLFTCSSSSCQGCPVQGQLQCHFGGRELLRFFGIALPVFIVGGIGIARVNGWLLLPWLVIILGYFGLVEIRVMCSHCPHYAEQESRELKCWANYGSPKLWKYRPGPMSQGEQGVFYAGLFLIAAYPLTFLLVWAQWSLLVLFTVTLVGMAGLMARTMCARCMNFACPFNHVEPGIREAFFARNPVVARAWRVE
jgi:hypothetical protein